MLLRLVILLECRNKGSAFHDNRLGTWQTLGLIILDKLRCKGNKCPEFQNLHIPKGNS